MAAPDALYLTDDPEACALIARDPLALLIGFALDQQVTVQKAFAGPLELQRRLGTLDAQRIATEDPDRLGELFARPPALHRYPRAMAGRVQDLAAYVVAHHDGDASRVWTEAESADDLRRRLGALPGFGRMKVVATMAVLANRFGVRPPGWEEAMPSYPTLGDVDSLEALARYQEHKRAYKRSLRDAGRSA